MAYGEDPRHWSKPLELSSFLGSLPLERQPLSLALQVSHTYPRRQFAGPPGQAGAAPEGNTHLSPMVSTQPPLPPPLTSSSYNLN